MKQNPGFKIWIEVPNQRVKKEIDQFLNRIGLPLDIR